jgi:hypothetical protein
VLYYLSWVKYPIAISEAILQAALSGPNAGHDMIRRPFFKVAGGFFVGA